MALTVFIALSAIGVLLLVCFLARFWSDGNHNRTASDHGHIHKVQS